MKYTGHLAMAIILMLVLSCVIDKQIKKDAQKAKETLVQTRTLIENAQKKYLKFKKSPQYAHIERYDQKYDWAGKYRDALAEVESAQTIENEIASIIRANNPEDEGKLKKKIEQLTGRLKLAVQKSRVPAEQRSTIVTLTNEGPRRVADSGDIIEQMDAILSDLRPLVDKTISDSKAMGWNKEEDIAARYAELEELAAEARTAQNEAEAQMGSGDPDYVAVGDALRFVSQKHAELQGADPLLRKKLDELGRNYTKRLIDMKTGHTVTIGRTCWHDMYDLYGEYDYLYAPRKVDEDAAVYFSKQKGAIAYGLSHVRPSDFRMWNQLQIDPMEEVSRRYYNEAEFWVDSVDMAYYHRYKIITGGREEVTDWQEVDEAEYAYHLNNLGMDIQSKPFGRYESEAIEEATPPGMVFVGNEKYGSWQKDSSGSSFWAFYGRYAFLNAMLGGNRYYYNDWHAWDRDYRGRKPYYGKNPDGTSRYGSSGSTVRTDQQYKSSTFARRGGIQAAPANIRSAAGAARGRGPGSRGK